MVIISLLLSIGASLFANLDWQVKELSGKIEAVDVLDYKKPIVSLKQNDYLSPNYLLDVSANSKLVVKEQDGAVMKITGPAMVALDQYKNFTADVFIIKGLVEFNLPQKSKNIKVETSTIRFNLKSVSEVKIESIDQGKAYQTISCTQSGNASVFDVNDEKLIDTKAGDNITFWRGRIIEKSLKKNI